MRARGMPGLAVPHELLMAADSFSATHASTVSTNMCTQPHLSTLMLAASLRCFMYVYHEGLWFGRIAGSLLWGVSSHAYRKPRTFRLTLFSHPPFAITHAFDSNIVPRLRARLVMPPSLLQLAVTHISASIFTIALLSVGEPNTPVAGHCRLACLKTFAGGAVLFFGSITPLRLSSFLERSIHLPSQLVWFVGGLHVLGFVLSPSFMGWEVKQRFLDRLSFCRSIRCLPLCLRMDYCTPLMTFRHGGVPARLFLMCSLCTPAAQGGRVQQYLPVSL